MMLDRDLGKALTSTEHSLNAFVVTVFLSALRNAASCSDVSLQ